MERDNFLGMVKNHFQYLFTDYGFSVTEIVSPGVFGNIEIILDSDGCGVAFIIDRRSLFIRVGQRGGPQGEKPSRLERWFELGVVVAFLTPEQKIEDLVHFYPILDKSLPYETRLDLELEQLARKTRPYWSKIIELCQGGLLACHSDELDLLSRRRSDALMDQIRREVESERGNHGHASRNDN